MEYSATPRAPSQPKCLRAMCSLNPKMPLSLGSSSCSATTASKALAFWKTCLTTPASSKGMPSSEIPTAPACKSSSKSVTCWPSKLIVAETFDLIWMASFAADSSTSSKVSRVDMVGLVLAIITTVVNPPAAAARAPVWISSLCVWPGSLKCTWISTRPGATICPLASITSALGSSIASAILTICFPSMRISKWRSRLVLGSRTRPFLISSIRLLNSAW